MQVTIPNGAIPALVLEVLQRGKYKGQLFRSQRELAEALGVTQATLSLWKNGVKEPSQSNLLKLGEFLKLTPEKLVKKLSGASSEKNKTSEKSIQPSQTDLPSSKGSINKKPVAGKNTKPISGSNRSPVKKNTSPQNKPKAQIVEVKSTGVKNIPTATETLPVERYSVAVATSPVEVVTKEVFTAQDLKTALGKAKDLSCSDLIQALPMLAEVVLYGCKLVEERQAEEIKVEEATTKVVVSPVEELPLVTDKGYNFFGTKLHRLRSLVKTSTEYLQLSFQSTLQKTKVDAAIIYGLLEGDSTTTFLRKEDLTRLSSVLLKIEGWEKGNDGRQTNCVILSNEGYEGKTYEGSIDELLAALG